MKSRLLSCRVVLFLLALNPNPTLSFGFGSLIALWKGNDTKPTDPGGTRLTKQEYEDIKEQLKDVRCPARVGWDLKDYWKCLWRTSLTAEGMEQESRAWLEDYVQQVKDEYKGYSEKWKLKEEREERKRMKREVVLKGGPSYSERKRIRRQTPLPANTTAAPAKKSPWNSEFWDVRKVSRIINDVATTLNKQPKDVDDCQYSEVLPGVSLKEFLNCLRTKSKKVKVNSDAITYRSVTDPPINNTYDTREFTLLNDSITRLHWGTPFIFEFDRLGDEESRDNFAGADPYLTEQITGNRYKYDNLDPNQHQPGWSYSGNTGPDKWHVIDLQKLYAPLVKGVDIKQMERIPDFAQTYPGLGEIAQDPTMQDLEAPMDFRWGTNTGYHIYTRYLLPVLSQADLDYYDFKGYLKGHDYNVSRDANNTRHIIDGIERFEHNTTKEPKDYAKEDDVPFNQVYKEFLIHYLNMDTNKYRGETANNNLKNQFGPVRKLFLYYIEAVKQQQLCVAEMVDQYEYRRDPMDLPDLFNKAYRVCIGDNTQGPFNESEQNYVHHPYVVNNETLEKLYSWYFDRKEARQRYSIPVFPFETPRCKHNEPSPIDIITTKGRKSSLRSYRFGNAGYELYRFFMGFPMDGSTLLTLGVVDAERNDETAVFLTGGAVKAQNLTFQMMHIRVADNWKAIGSEHYIDGKGAQMELQMVFTIAGTADTLEYWHILARVANQLFQFREKLVIILSVLVDVVETQEELIKLEEETKQDPFLFEPLAQAAYHLRKQAELHPNEKEPRGYVSKDRVFRFVDFTPQVESKFYTYRGSLSWVPCFGYVIWSVFEQRLYITKRQFDEFARIPAIGMSDNNKASSNNRRFSDIYVEEEHSPGLSYDQRQAMMRRRTVDRYILEGKHVPATIDDGSQGVVPDAFYFFSEESHNKANMILKQDKILSLLCILIVIKSCQF